MGSLWASVSLLFGLLLLGTEGEGQQQTKSNVPRLKLSYKGQLLKGGGATLSLCRSAFIPTDKVVRLQEPEKTLANEKGVKNSLFSDK